MFKYGSKPPGQAHATGQRAVRNQVPSRPVQRAGPRPVSPLTQIPGAALVWLQRAAAEKALGQVHGDDASRPLTREDVAPNLAGHRDIVEVAQRPAQAEVQAKLAIGAADHPLEQEADQVADQVMRMPALTGSAPPMSSPEIGAGSALQRSAADEQEIQCKSDGCANGMTASPGGEASIDAINSGGVPLPESTRAFFEPRFGVNFRGVRIHHDDRADTAARAVNARAFTRGADVVFRQGEFQPDTHEGQRLLAHELAHVVQQGAAQLVGHAEPLGDAAGPGLQRTHAAVIQRAVSCNVDHLDKECGNAAATCATIQDGYCKSHYPSDKDIEALYTKTKAGIAAKSSSYPNAAANLTHYLDGSGSEKVMPFAIVKADDSCQDKLKGEHRDKFIEGAQKRLADGRLKPGGPAVEMAWTGTANAFHVLSFTDLGLALGGYTLCSRVKVSAVDKGGGSVEIHFDEWKVQAFDCYNWDPGKGIGVGGFDDNDLCCLENAGKAKHFRVRTDEWINDLADAMAPATISAAKPSPPPAGGSGGKSGGDSR